MARAFKIVITGAFNAGKTEFIRNASDIETVSTERPISDELIGVKQTTTVAMDYGQATIDGHLFHLYGTPGQERFEFMQDILSQEMDGLLLIVNGVDRPSFSTARRILRRLRRRKDLPVLVVATWQDAKGALKPDELVKTLKLEPPVTATPCDPRERPSTHQVLREMLALLGPRS